MESTGSNSEIRKSNIIYRNTCSIKDPEWMKVQTEYMKIEDIHRMRNMGDTFGESKNTKHYG